MFFQDFLIVFILTVSWHFLTYSENAYLWFIFMDTVNPSFFLINKFFFVSYLSPFSVLHAYLLIYVHSQEVMFY